MFVLTAIHENPAMGHILTLLFDQNQIIGCTKTEWEILEDGPDAKTHRSGQTYASVQDKITQWEVLDDNNNQFPLAVIDDRLVVLENNDDVEPCFTAMMEIEWFQELNKGV